MKHSTIKHIALSTMAILCLPLLLTCCKGKETVFEYDEYGVVNKINPEEKSVYLVFTGHYSANDSGRFENFDGAEYVLDVLKEKGVHGSFFPTGVCFDVDKYKPIIKRIIDDGNYLSAHSYSHLLLCDESDRSKSLCSEDSITADFKKAETVLQRYGLSHSDYEWTIPPYECYNQFSANVMRKIGFKLINPTKGLVTDMDWMGPKHPQYQSAKELVDNIWRYEKEHTLNGTILLLHAMNYPDRVDSDRTYRYLGEIIDSLSAIGYTFKTMKDVK